MQVVKVQVTVLDTSNLAQNMLIGSKSSGLIQLCLSSSSCRWTLLNCPTRSIRSNHLKWLLTLIILKCFAIFTKISTLSFHNNLKQTRSFLKSGSERLKILLRQNHLLSQWKPLSLLTILLKILETLKWNANQLMLEIITMLPSNWDYRFMG